MYTTSREQAGKHHGSCPEAGLPDRDGLFDEMIKARPPNVVPGL